MHVRKSSGKPKKALKKGTTTSTIKKKDQTSMKFI